jgi:putative addiction module component (TIGR02574 family)
MSQSAEQVLEAAMALSVAERAEVAARLQESLAGFATPEIATAWKAEIAQRIRAADAGEMASIPAEDVHARLKAKYGFFGD